MNNLKLLLRDLETDEEFELTDKMPYGTYAVVRDARNTYTSAADQPIIKIDDGITVKRGGVYLQMPVGSSFMVSEPYQSVPTRLYNFMTQLPGGTIYSPEPPTKGK